MLVMIMLRLGWAYHTYLEFVSKPFYYTYATVISVHSKTKQHHRYQVLKLNSDEGLHFYTVSYSHKDFMNKRIRLKIFPSDHIRFWEFMDHFYIKSRIVEVKPHISNLRDTLAEKIRSQHNDRQISAFYNALFLALPVDKSLRERISLWGISHLVALSGFHLGILWAVTFALLLFFYRPMQQRFFPYRYDLIDIGSIAIVLLGLFVYFVDAPPSLLRSYAMVVAGWLVVIAGIELISFEFLGTVGLVLILILPSLLFSLSFWLSIAGVFYIYLLLYYGRHIAKRHMMWILLPLGIFLLMLPVVHLFFPLVTSYQLFSPFLSLLFVLFYPFTIFLHLLGKGEILDPLLAWWFSIKTDHFFVALPLWLWTGYIALSLGAIWSRKLFLVLLLAALCFGIYLYGWIIWKG